MQTWFYIRQYGCCTSFLRPRPHVTSKRVVNTVEMHSLVVLEVRSPNPIFLYQSQGVSRAILPSEAPGENPFLYLLLLVAVSIPWLVVTPLQSLPLSLHCHLLLCLSNLPQPLSFKDIAMACEPNQTICENFLILKTLTYSHLQSLCHTK